MRIHLDTDLGGDIDDLCALALLLSWPDVEITGITTVAEVEGRRAGYTRYALALAGHSDIPVAAGADGSCGRYRSPIAVPREESYWPERITPTSTPLTEAMDLLKRSVEAGATVVAIGPYTNLALFDEAYPGLLGQTKVYAMGGHVFPSPAGFPRWDNSDDFNIQFDVISARHVLDKVGPTLIPVEATAQTALRRAYLPALRSSGDFCSLLADQAEAFAAEYRYEKTYGATCPGLPDDIINFQHDPLACAVALGWEGATIESIGLRTEMRDGWLHEQLDDAGNRLSIVTAVEGARFNDDWLRIVRGMAG